MSHTLHSISDSQVTKKLEGERISVEFVLPVVSEQTISFTKYISYHTSKDYPESELMKSRS